MSSAARANEAVRSLSRCVRLRGKKRMLKWSLQGRWSVVEAFCSRTWTFLGNRGLSTKPGDGVKLAGDALSDVVSWLQQDLLPAVTEIEAPPPSTEPETKSDATAQKRSSLRSVELAADAEQAPTKPPTATPSSKAGDTVKESALQTLATLLRSTYPEFAQAGNTAEQASREVGTESPVAHAEQVIRVNVRLTKRKTFRSILDWTLDDYIQTALSIQTWDRRFLVSVNAGVTPHVRVHATQLRLQKSKPWKKVLEQVVMKSTSTAQFSWIAALERIFHCERVVHLPQSPPPEYIERRKLQAALRRALHKPIQRNHRRFWSDDEHRVLLERFQKFGPEWEKVAKALPGRTPFACRDRLHRLLGSK
ncbi:hypothetical protein F1559_004629 [Cyanidiococcus yangmingshanensis]|uniref:Myb-like domain-containing protein n=1 Tax=Cyanidiococcus yangmingshanensis TaxID=2690220 RepID=A0A7J7IQE6_9RHOD|nr:hypothetical protein F1559_004629 [Cyanidiococcus yangmingshanensis]